MRKSMLCALLACFFVAAMVSLVGAVPLTSESVITNPSSTDNLWRYSLHTNNPNIENYLWAADETSQYTATFQGYVRGDKGQWSPASDSFYGDDTRSTYVFETYLMSSVEQTVKLSAGGDDGRSIFVDDTLLAKAGYDQTSAGDLLMSANTVYKITLAHNNYNGRWTVWFNIKGDYDSSTNTYGWSGPFSQAQNITMNADGSFGQTAVPEPTTMLLFGAGVAGLAALGRRRK